MQFLHSTVALCWFWRNLDTRATQKSWNQAGPRCVASVVFSQFSQCFFRPRSRNWHHPWRPNNLCGYISQTHQMKSCLKQWKILCANFIQSQGCSLCPGTNVAGGQFAVYFELWTPKCVSNCYNFYSVSNLHFFAILFWYCVCTLYQHVFVNGMSHVWCRHEWRWRVPTRPSPDWKKVYDSDSGRLWRHLIRWFRWYDSNDPPKQSGDSGLLVCHVEILKAEEIDEVVPAARSFGFNNTSICDSFIQFHSFGTSRPFKIFLIATACISLCTTWIVWRHSHAESGPYPDMVTVKLYGYWVIAPFNCNVDPFC